MISPLSRARRIGYGGAELGITGAEALVRVSLMIFYTDVVGLDPALTGYVIAAGVLWDAVTDPLMGRITDHISLWGERRRPYIAFGSLLLSVSVYSLFAAPDLSSELAKATYLLLTYLLFNTAMTIVAVPHAALAGDMSEDGPVRTELFGWRLIFANMGLVLGTAVPGLVVLVSGAGDEDRTTSMILSLVILLASSWTLLATRGRDPGRSRQTVDWSLRGYLKETRQVLANRGFLVLAAAYATATLGLALNSSLALYFYRYRLLLDETVTRGIIAVFMAVFCLAVPLWIWLGGRFSKRVLLGGGILGLGVMTSLLYPVLPAKEIFGPMLAAVIGGLCIASVVLLDVAVARESRGKFGLYFGFWKMVAKLSRALALVLTGQLLSLIGFSPGTVQAQSTSDQLATLFGPGVGFFLILSALVIGFYKEHPDE